jgi:uncharacterized membrane protein
MLKSLGREITLAVQARSGLTGAAVVLFALIALALLTTFVFLCVAGYAWFALQVGSAFAALIMAGIFVLIAVIAAIVCAMARRRARERAILERAARAHAPSWLLDPRILSAAVQAGRSLGWQRIVPVALLGVMAAQWAREYRQHTREADNNP